MKTIKRVLWLFPCLAACLALACAAAGQPAVVYDGAAKALTVENTAGSDLFAEMKEMMPGDVCTQTITLTAKNLGGTATFWLKAEADPHAALDLSGFTLAVYADGTLVSSGPAVGSSELENGVELCQLQKDGSVSLQVELKMPEEAGNEYAGAAERLYWTFIVEDTSDDTHTEASPGEDSPLQAAAALLLPKTGDTATLAAWGALLALGLGGLAALRAARKRRG